MTFEDYLVYKGFTSSSIEKILKLVTNKRYNKDSSKIKLEKLWMFFNKLGFEDKEIRRIIARTPEYLGYDLETLGNKYKELIAFGGSSKLAFYLVRELPNILSYGKETIKAKVREKEKELTEYSYKEDEAIELIKKSPRILGISNTLLNEKWNFLLSLGYTSKQIKNMSKKFSDIFYYGVDNIKEKYVCLQEIGYTSNQVIELTTKLPKIFSYTNDSIIQKITQVIELGYSLEEVIAMTVALPSMLSGDLEKIILKIKFYKKIGLMNIIKKYPQNLIQGLDLSYARYMFYLQTGITIDEDSYRRLFVGQKYFEHTHGIDNEHLIMLYPIDYNFIFDNELILTRTK